MDKLYKAIGLMSGTSMDGIDLAFIESDGKNNIINKKFYYKPYSEDFKKKLRTITYSPNNSNLVNLENIKVIENEFTNITAELVMEFLNNSNLSHSDIDLIGFHGHTILHNPAKSITWQIGNGQLLACKTKINVIGDFRTKDLVLGGQGAPLVPIYHFYLLSNQNLPTAILNIGGISNITYFKNADENSIEAFDVCFGNAPLDDLVKEFREIDFDHNGEIAAKGVINLKIANNILKNDIFNKKPPKSFHREDFLSILSEIKTLKLEDKLATLCCIHASVIDINLSFFAENPKQIFLCGGGRKNKTLVKQLKIKLAKRNIEVLLIDKIGFDGDAIEAEAFAFLAIRSAKNLPISFQKTTGVLQENNCVPASYQPYFSSCGGVFYRA